MHSFVPWRVAGLPLLRLAAIIVVLCAWAVPVRGDDSRNPLQGESSPPENQRPNSNDLPEGYQPEEESAPEEEEYPEEEDWKDPESWSEDEERDESWELYSREATDVVAAFRQVVQTASYSTVEVMCDEELKALGAVVSADGEIITKASELSGQVVCVFRDGRRLPAEILAQNEEYDLALIKVQAQDLTPVEWSDSPELPLGSWLITPGPQEEPVAIGVVSVAPRRILPVSGILGIVIEEGDRGPVVMQVLRGSAAESAGVEVNDVVLRVNGERTETRETLVDIIRQYRPGTRIRLVVERGSREVEIEASLGHRPTDPDHDLSAYQNSLGGRLSVRRAGFPSVMQHDTPLAPRQCGGPILDLDGKTVGINIARAGRVNSYAVPAATVQVILAQLRGGELAAEETLPPDVQQVGIEEQLQALHDQLAERQADIDEATQLRDGAQSDMIDAQERLEEALMAADELQQRIAELEAELSDLEEQDAESAAGDEDRREAPSLRNKAG